jgi:hypothetical protein
MRAYRHEAETAKREADVDEKGSGKPMPKRVKNVDGIWRSIWVYAL